MPEIYITLAYILAYIGIFATSFYIISLLTFYRKNKEPEPATDKTVTIIIPAYNEEKSIGRTIESALSLSYPEENLEIIIIDDGSKDKTYEIAKKFESSSSPKIKIFTRPNGGKGSALNLGIKKAAGEIILTMDADTFVEKDALKKMVGYFTSEKVACVAPSMAIYEPKKILQRIQQIEYYMGVFLRKSFASMNAIHITPGAFSAYRKRFFLEHGYFDEHNLTEDLEMALRIQDKNKIIENAHKAVAYTIAPGKFKPLLYQRRRWYAGLMKNLWNYRHLFGIRKGALGTIVLPTAVTTIILSVFLTSYMIVKIALKIKDEIASLNSINFEFADYIELNKFVLERTYYMLFSSKIFLLSILFIVLLTSYMYYAKKNLKFKDGIKFSFILFMVFYSMLFALWWIVSFFYVLLNKKVVWREQI